MSASSPTKENSNAELIRRLYDAFAERDGETMAACYHAEAEFSDPVFTDLRGTEVGAMWRMLCERGRDLKIEYGDVTADGDRGGARWQAWYTFTGTGRPVHNRVEATFAFADGKIIEHRDAFDFWAWTRMALGLPGLILGWSPPIQNKVRTTARKGLDAWLAKNGEA